MHNSQVSNRLHAYRDTFRWIALACIALGLPSHSIAAGKSPEKNAAAPAVNAAGAASGESAGDKSFQATVDKGIRGNLAGIDTAAFDAHVGSQ